MNFANKVRKYMQQSKLNAEGEPVGAPPGRTGGAEKWDYIPKVKAGSVWGQIPNPRAGGMWGQIPNPRAGGIWGQIPKQPAEWQPLAMQSEQGGDPDFPHGWEEPTPLPSPSPNPYGRPDPNVFINRVPPGFGNRGSGESIVDNPIANRFLSTWSNFGNLPMGGFAPGGPTMIPTFWNNYPGVGYVPMAVPPGGWNPDGGNMFMPISHHTPQKKPN